jgi:hypothetical protein
MGMVRFQISSFVASFMAVLLFSAIASAGQFYTSSELLQDCKSQSSDTYSKCVGYLMGVYDYVANLDQMYPDNNVKICYYLIGSDELVDSYISGMRGQPQLWNSSAHFGAVVSFKSFYGCK